MRETLGPGDGTERTFRTSRSWMPDTLRVDVCGIDVEPDETGERTLTLPFAPLASEPIVADYEPA